MRWNESRPETLAAVKVELVAVVAVVAVLAMVVVVVAVVALVAVATAVGMPCCTFPRSMPRPSRLVRTPERVPSLGVSGVVQRSAAKPGEPTVPGNLPTPAPRSILIIAANVRVMSPSTGGPALTNDEGEDPYA